MAAYDWDSTIQNDGSDFRLLPEGIYPFTVKKMERGYYNGGNTIPPCPRADLTLHVGVGADTADVTEGILLDDSLEWKLCQFFLAIGDRKHGEALKMNWDAVEGKGGWCEIGHRTWTGRDGEERESNQVVRFIDPQDAPADGKPILKDAADSDEDGEW